MRWLVLFICLLTAGMGCATAFPNVEKELASCRQSVSDKQERIEAQQAAIEQKEQAISEKEETISSLNSRIGELEHRLKISYSEQERYDERIQRVTSAVRDFIKKQIQEERTFLTDVALEDFIGNPLVERQYLEDPVNLIIDVAHPVPGQGQINGIGGYFKGNGEIFVKLLRPVGEDYLVTHSKSLQVAADEPGKKLIDFDKPIFVNQDDILAFYFPDSSVVVSYDTHVGVHSYHRMRKDRYPNGTRLKADDIERPEQTKRKYSLNYYGIFLKNK